MNQKYQAITQDLHTIGDYIRWSVSQFSKAELCYGHGTDNAWDEAVALILQTLHLPATINPQVFSARLTQAERLQLLDLLEKRVQQRIPVAYLTHEAWFCGLKFYVDERVIIPRSPMAELIETGFEPWANHLAIDKILDLCTGSGCIAIACAEAFPEAEIDAVDISEDALNVTRMNIAKHHLHEQVNAIQSNLFNQLSDKRYDIIISNPPYVDQQDMQTLPIEYQHEPVLALAAGSDGLTLVKQILKQAAHHLTPEGLLFVEVGNSEAALVEQYPEVPFTWLEFERGGNGVFLLTAQQLKQYAEQW